MHNAEMSDALAPTGWAKVADWRYVHATLDLTVEHDTEGWALIHLRSGLTYGKMFPTAEEAMRFADSGRW